MMLWHYAMAGHHPSCQPNVSVEIASQWSMLWPGSFSRSEGEAELTEEDEHDYKLPSCVTEDLRPAICVARALHVIPTLPITPALLMGPGIGRNASCTFGNCLTSRPKGRLQPRELWFLMGLLV